MAQVDCEVRAGEAERVGTDLLTSELADNLPGDMEGLAESFERLQHSLQQAQEYVDAVVVSGGGGACMRRHGGEGPRGTAVHVALLSSAGTAVHEP